MEIRQIPDYPNYGATKDGRIFSYYTNKFLKVKKQPRCAQVMLTFEGLTFWKTVGRLVFIAFYGYEPECITYRDGDVYNTRLDNLVETTRAFVARWSYYKKEKMATRESLKFCKVNPETSELEIVAPRPKSPEYLAAMQCSRYKRITYKGFIYYKVGKKEELITSLQYRIRHNNWLIESVEIAIPIPRWKLKKFNSDNQKYIEVLKGINDEQNNNL